MLCACRRKFLVYIAGSLMFVACVFFALTRSFTLDILLGFVFGLGYGCFSAIDWAMVPCLGGRMCVRECGCVGRDDVSVWYAGMMR